MPYPTYYHLAQRARRLRRARALRDNLPYQLDIPSLDNLYALRNAITEIVQALGSGQLDPRAAGKMLYGIQQASAINRRIEKMEAAQAEERNAAPDEAPATEHSRIHEYPDFEKQLGLAPGVDVDAETAFVLRKADAEAELRRPDPMPTTPPGLRPGSPAYRIYREEAYQGMQMQINSMRAQLRDYYEIKRQETAKEIEKMKQEMMSAAPVSSPATGTESAAIVTPADLAAKKPPASSAAGEPSSDAAKTA